MARGCHPPLSLDAKQQVQRHSDGAPAAAASQPRCIARPRSGIARLAAYVLLLLALLVRTVGAAAAEAAAAASPTDAASSSEAAAAAAAGGAYTPATGYISPPAGVPVYNPAPWNAAYKLTLRGVPAPHSGKELAASLMYPQSMLVNIQPPSDCSRAGFDTQSATSAPLGTCYARSSAAGAGATDFWVKVPGLTLATANCYCYALGFWRGGYCYPGTKTGAGVDDLRQRMTCKALHAAVLADGGEAVQRAAALSGQPVAGHYIALLARPESCIRGHCYLADFHAMRKDASGTWSWKHPGMPATNRDLFGKLVTDPEAAALLGSYQLCGYYRVEPLKMLFADKGSPKQPGPLAMGPMLERYRAMPGVTIEVTPLPYNEATDAALSAASKAVVEEDRAWEAGRGSEQYRAWRVREKQALELLPRGVVTEAAAAAADTRVSERDGTSGTSTTSSSNGGGAASSGANGGGAASSGASTGARRRLLRVLPPHGPPGGWPAREHTAA